VSTEWHPAPDGRMVGGKVNLQLNEVVNHDNGMVFITFTNFFYFMKGEVRGSYIKKNRNWSQPS
jgi:hypothetical protein